MSLRSGAVEAIARGTLKRRLPGGLANVASDAAKLDAALDAVAALDSLLVFLGEHTEEWDEAARSLRRVPTSIPGISLFLAVLGSGEENP